MEYDFDEQDDFGGEEGAEQFFNQEVVASPDFVQKSDSVIFVIDCQKHLFQQNGEEKTQMNVILKSIQSFMQSKIISSASDQVGLILYNVAQDSNNLGFKGINRVYSLDVPSAQRIVNVVKIENEFLEKYNFSNNESALFEVLWLCSSEFQNLDKTKYDRRIFLFTPNDDPHSNDQKIRDQTIHHFSETYNSDIQIELLPLRKLNGEKFDIKKFYINVLQIDIDDVNSAVLDTTEAIMQISDRLRQKEYKKRTLNRLLFELGNNVKAAVKLYCHLNKAKKPSARKLHKETNKPLKRETKLLCTETAQLLYEGQIGTYYELSGEKVRITKQEMDKIKTFDNPSMKLMGFKPRSKLKLYHNYKTSYFVYPDEQRVKGSSQLFHALITQMLAKGKIAIVRLIPRAKSQVRFCALLPQEESHNEKHFQTPPGFNLIYLPYADDLRTLKEKMPKEHTEIPKDLLDIGKLLVTSLDLLDFDPRQYEDPALQKFYAHLQAHALEEDNPEDVRDLLQPDEEGLKRHEELLNLFQRQLDLSTNDSGPKIKKEVTKKKQTGGLNAKIVVEKKETKKTTKKATKKGGKGKNKMEEELGNESEDSRENDNQYDYDDGFVVPDEESDGDFVPKKGKKQTKNRKQKKEYEDEDQVGIQGLTQQESDQIKVNDIETKIMNFQMDNLKIDDVKFYLKQNNLNDKGKKLDDLVSRAMNYISEKNAN